jgi:hypothetical protein
VVILFCILSCVYLLTSFLVIVCVVACAVCTGAAAVQHTVTYYSDMLRDRHLDQVCTRVRVPAHIIHKKKKKKCTHAHALL